MGYLGVKTIVAHIKGNAVERRIDTGVQLVTRDKMKDPAMNELLHPDLGR
jgi:ribose transport system substrate-binding protein